MLLYKEIFAEFKGGDGAALWQAPGTMSSEARSPRGALQTACWPITISSPVSPLPTEVQGAPKADADSTADAGTCTDGQGAASGTGKTLLLALAAK